MVKEISKMDFDNKEIDPIISLLLEQNMLPNSEEDLKRLFPDIFQRETLNIEDFLRQMPKLKNQREASERINDAIRDREKIRVHGDFDGDGIFSTLILLETLQFMDADVDFFIPDRLEDGYGLKKQDIEKDIADGINLIITCDNGISCKEEVDFAKENGIDVIVTDHHLLMEGMTPEGIIVVDPKMSDEFSDISGGFVALKLATELLGISAGTIDLLRELTVFAAITTITDLMPLLCENRLLLKSAFTYIDFLKANKIWSGRVLKVISGLGGYYFLNDPYKTTAVDLFSFQIGPTINAVSRINGNVTQLVNDILNCNQSGVFIPNTYTKLNGIRKERTEEVYQTYTSEDMPAEIVVLNTEDFKYRITGLLGLIANKISNSKGKPALVGFDRGTEYDFSGRSIGGYSLQEAIQRIKDTHPELKIAGGGHAQAMGIRLEKTNNNELEIFKEAFYEDFEKNFDKECFEELQCEFYLEDENIDQVVEVHERFHNFGAGFRPLNMFFEGFVEDVSTNGVVTISGYSFRYYQSKLKPIPFKVGSFARVHFTIQTDDIISGPYFKISKYEVNDEEVVE